MKAKNQKKYTAYPTVNIPDRSWPDRVITQAPVWCSVDLRDGNQALSVPMDVEQKLRMFDLLISIGFKEIEVGFPSASAVEFQFVRRLIEEGRIPADVTIQVLTPARAQLIERTFAAVAGARQVIVHLYNSTSRAQREQVFKKDKPEICAIAVEAARQIRGLADRHVNGVVRFQYSPESFTGTELDYALEVCEEVSAAWGATAANPMIINLPATVEMSTPNVYADRIEWFGRRLRDRAAAVISVHTHNDRGTAVAAAELAVMAGAQRVEGALFGNGERSGNMDIVTMALNLFSQGVETGLDFSDINRVLTVYRECTGMTVHPRHPYAGDLVYTAFSGSHQDAINKGLKARAKNPDGRWDVPYLPIDPQDVGRSYEAIIRINSQSGKGGMAYIMESEFGFQIPKWMQPHFGSAVQAVADRKGTELSPAEIYEVFSTAYLTSGDEGYRLRSCRIHSDDDEPGGDPQTRTRVSCQVTGAKRELVVEGQGNGPVDAFVRGLRAALGIDFVLEEYAEHALSHSSDAQAAAYVKIRTGAGAEAFGVGLDSHIGIASMRAVVNAVNQIAR